MLVRKMMIVTLHRDDVVTPRRNPVTAIIGRPENIGVGLLHRCICGLNVLGRTRDVVDVEIAYQFGRHMVRARSQLDFGHDCHVSAHSRPL